MNSSPGRMAADEMAAEGGKGVEMAATRANRSTPELRDIVCSLEARTWPRPAALLPCSEGSPGHPVLRANPFPSPRVLPEPYASTRGNVIPVSRPHVRERSIPPVHVSHHAVDPVLGRTVRVREQALARGFVLHLGAPALPERQEEALISGVAVQNRRGLAAQGDVVRLVRDAHARQVGDVLSERQLSVDVDALERLVLIVLLRERIGPLVEVLPVRLRPPAPKHAEAVVFRALVVEPVADLMTDDRADPAVVGRVVRRGIELRRLQDPRRED